MTTLELMEIKIQLNERIEEKAKELGFTYEHLYCVHIKTEDEKLVVGCCSMTIQPENMQRFVSLLTYAADLLQETHYKH